MDNINTSAIAVIKLILTGILVFIALRLANYLLLRLVQNKKASEFILKRFPIVEVFVWLIFFVYAAKVFVSDNLFAAIVLLVMFTAAGIWTGRDIIRDFISGIRFRTDKNLKHGAHIKTIEGEGEIVQFNSRNLHLRTNEGSNIFIPYSKLAGSTIERPEVTDATASRTFKLKVKSPYSPPELKRVAERELLLLPWVSPKKNPIVSVSSEGADILKMTVSINAADEAYYSKIENYLKEKFSN